MKTSEVDIRGNRDSVATRPALPRRFVALGIAGFGLAALVPDAPLAQAAEAKPVESRGVAGADSPAAAGTSTGVDSGGLENVIVTARRRQESIQDAPVQITAFSADTLKKSSVENLQALNNLAPQLIVSKGFSGTGATISIRGVNTSRPVQGLEQSVAVVVDGAYYGDGRVIQESFIDMEQVEILKGPQAFFFGKNATAGVISITTASPTDKPYTNLKGGYEIQAEQAYGELVLSRPVTDTFGIRGAFRASKMFGGYYQNRATDSTYTTRDVANRNAPTAHFMPAGDHHSPGEREFFGRVTAKWNPTEQLAATLKASGTYTDTNSSGWNLHPVKCPHAFQTLNPTDPCGPGFYIYQSKMPPDIAQTLPFGVAESDGANLNRYRSVALTGQVDYRLESVTLNSISNYQWFHNQWSADANWEAPARFFAIEDSSMHAWSTELRGLTNFHGPVNLLFGLYYQIEQERVQQAAPQAGFENSAAPAPFRYVGNVKSGHIKDETVSPYGQLIYRFLQNWELSGGVRYIAETKDSLFVQPYSNPIGVANGTWVVNQPLAPHQSFSDSSPEVSLKWQPSEAIMLYAAYKTAYKAGGFDIGITEGKNTTLANSEFKPESGKGFEAGIKSTLLDGQLRFNLTPYRFKYTNLQIENFDPTKIALVATNAGSTIVKGIELETQWAPRAVRGLRIDGMLNYNQARYEKFIAPCWVGQTPAQGCTLVTSQFGPSQDISGMPTALAPLWTANLAVEYELPVAGRWLAGLSVNGRYSDEYFTNPYAHPFSVQPSYAMVDASIRLFADDDRWQLMLIGKNLTNKFIITGGQEGLQTGSGTGTARGVPSDYIGFGNEPRTIRVLLTMQF